MLVRIKKRGELPPPCFPIRRSASGVSVSNLYRGCVIEVEACGEIYVCGTQEYRITDSRILALVDGSDVYICDHYLIDDLNAYDSDSCDEQAEIGDLAMAEVVRPVEVKR